MVPSERIQMARRHAGLSQARLASLIGVQRSAVSHWESRDGKQPTVAHIRQLAIVTGVQFEWLATGRGRMLLSAEVLLDAIPAVQGLLIEDPLELRLIKAVRNTTLNARMTLTELAEMLARERTGSARLRE